LPPAITVDARDGVELATGRRSTYGFLLVKLAAGKGIEISNAKFALE
jgi:hypothetical protein